MAKRNMMPWIFGGAAVLAAAWYFLSPTTAPPPGILAPLPVPGTGLKSPQLVFLEQWAESSPNPEYLAMVDSLNMPDTMAMYTIVHDYFSIPNPPPVPDALQQVWNRVAAPYSFGH